MNNSIVSIELKVLPLKQIFEILKNTIAKVPMEFVKGNIKNKDKTKNDEESSDEKIENEGGIKIYATSDTNALLLCCKLFSSQMSVFNVEEDMKVNFDVQSVYKFINSLEPRNSIKIYIYKNTQDKITFDAGNTKHTQQLLCVNSQEKIPKKIEFHISAIINAKQLKSTCKRMEIYGDVISIRCTKNELTFKYLGDGSSGMDVYSVDDKENPVTIEYADAVPDDYIYVGYFNIKYLSLFGKIASSSEDITLTFKQKYLMFITMQIGASGVMLCGITPQDENNKCKIEPRKQIEMNAKN